MLFRANRLLNASVTPCPRHRRGGKFAGGQERLRRPRMHHDPVAVSLRQSGTGSKRRSQSAPPGSGGCSRRSGEMITGPASEVRRCRRVHDGPDEFPHEVKPPPGHRRPRQMRPQHVQQPIILYGGVEDRSVCPIAGPQRGDIWRLRAFARARPFNRCTRPSRRPRRMSASLYRIARPGLDMPVFHGRIEAARIERRRVLRVPARTRCPVTKRSGTVRRRGARRRTEGTCAFRPMPTCTL